MKIMFRSLIVGILACSCLNFANLSEATASDLYNGPASFCLQSFNAYGPIYAPYVETRTEKMAGFFRSNPTCEMIQLQEVWTSSQALLLQSSLQDRFSASAPNLERKIGLMSFAMGPILSSQTHLFSQNNEGGLMDGIRQALHIYKAFHALKFQPVSSPEELWFINLHLHQSSESIRLSQLLEVLSWRVENSNLKWILSGDFNSDQAGPEREFILNVMGLRDAMEEALGGYGSEYCTYCSSNPLSWLSTSKVFDYVFYSNGGGNGAFQLKPVEGEVNMTGTMREPWSDHFGLRVTFELQDSEAKILGYLQSRKERALESIKSSVYIFNQDPQKFSKELQQLFELRRQLQNEVGPYWDYFQQSI